MSKTKHEKGDTVYLPDGNPAEYVAKLYDGGHVVREIHGREDCEPWMGAVREVARVLSEPPTEVATPALERARLETEKLRAEAAKLRDHITQARADLAEVDAGVKRHAPLRDAIRWMDAGARWVYVDSSWTTGVIDLEAPKEGGTLEYLKLRVRCTTGQSGSATWYGEADGYRATLCESREEALRLVADYVSTRVEKGDMNDATRAFEATPDAPYSDEVRAAVRAYQRENLAKRRDKATEQVRAHQKRADEAQAALLALDDGSAA